MGMDGKTCPKCGGRMGQGFILELADHSMTKATNWVEGEPEKGMLGMIKLRGRRKFPIRTFRCERCNLLESYAPEA